jgi:predicted amidohydrolase
MSVKIAMCQVRSTVGDVGLNLDRILSTISQVNADVYVFPELFLTGYGADYGSLKEDVEMALNKLTLWCSEKDIAIAVGAPMYIKDTIRNSLYFVTQSSTIRYDKLYLAKFGIYSERVFRQGSRPVIAEFKGMRFGLSICYDIFFPEIFRFYAVNGADVNICISASAEPSREFFERVAPARSLENVIYTVFVNNVGAFGDTEFFGHSRLIGPIGNTVSEADEKECIKCVCVDGEVVRNARKIRTHMSDLRSDIDWHV